MSGPPRIWRQVVTLSTQEVAGRVQGRTSSSTRRVWGPHSLSPLWSVPLQLAVASEVEPCLLRGGHGPYFHFSLGHLRQTSDGPETKLVLDPNILMSSFYRTCCLEYFVTGFMIVICFFIFIFPPRPRHCRPFLESVYWFW